MCGLPEGIQGFWDRNVLRLQRPIHRSGTTRNQIGIQIKHKVRDIPISMGPLSSRSAVFTLGLWHMPSEEDF